MPIGFDAGPNGGNPDQIDQGLQNLQDLWDQVTDFVDDVLEQVWDWVKTIVRVWRWVRRLVQEIYFVPIFAWHTANDERTCPQCGGLAGQQWPEDEGEFPPAHNNCRCSRVFHHDEPRTRFVYRWVRELDFVVNWEWQVTGWA